MNNESQNFLYQLKECFSIFTFVTKLTLISFIYLFTACTSIQNLECVSI